MMMLDIHYDMTAIINFIQPGLSHFIPPSELDFSLMLSAFDE